MLIDVCKKLLEEIAIKQSKNKPAYLAGQFGGVMVSTGMWKPDKRAVDCTSYVKMCTLNTNAKNNNNFALAA